jgi:23S rRNA (cytosine1962-C5)-methyltransferase
MTSALLLKTGHVQPVWAGHPWVYAQAVERIEGGALRGEPIEVFDPERKFLGHGLYSPSSAIVTRILSRARSITLTPAFFRDAILQATARRKTLGLGGPGETGFRVVHSEGDMLGGLIVDCLGDTLVVQLLTAGMHRLEPVILGALQEALRPTRILDKTPERFAKLEGTQAMRGELWRSGTNSDADYRFSERNFEYLIPVALNQKTGYYFDQRSLRARIEALSANKSVLDTYSYVGSFALAAKRGGAKRVVSVDQNALACEVGAENAKRNGLDGVDFICGDAKNVLTEAKGAHDLVILDPPRLAPSKKNRESAIVHYTRLAMLGTAALKPGGLLVLCSCSSAIDLPTLTRCLATGARKANADAIVLERHFQAPDHPVPAAFPEGLYLKALIAQIVPRGH